MSARHPVHTAADARDYCHALNARNERTAQRAEAAVWLVMALAIGCPLGWWIVEWLACEVC